jgi:hypothetical protein
MVSLTTSCTQRLFYSAKRSAVSLGQEIKTTLACNIPKSGTDGEPTSSQTSSRQSLCVYFGTDRSHHSGRGGTAASVGFELASIAWEVQPIGRIAPSTLSKFVGLCPAWFKRVRDLGYPC